MKTQITLVAALTLSTGTAAWAQTASGPGPNNALKTPNQGADTFNAFGAGRPDEATATAPSSSAKVQPPANSRPSNRGYPGGSGAGGMNPGALGRFSAQYPIWYGSGGAPGPGAVSVTVFSPADQKVLEQTAEDLRILSFLLSRKVDQAFADDAPDYKLGIPMLLTANGQAVEASYLEGFGVILKVRVAFPLLPPPGWEKSRGAPQGTSDWDEARRALEGAAARGEDELTWAPQQGAGYRFGGGEPARYEPKLVETFKHRLLALLKNASNLRHVQAEESIVVRITGQPSVSGPHRELVKASDPTAQNTLVPPEDKTLQEITFEGPTSELNHPTVMTLRVKKAAVDAFAAGKLSEEQFVKAAAVTTYFDPMPPEGGRLANRHIELLGP